MLTTECPICDEPAFVEAALVAIECAACGRVDIATDPLAIELAQAA